MPNDKLTATDELPPVQNQEASGNSQLTATDTLPPLDAATGTASKPGLLTRADQAITNALAPNPKNYESDVDTNRYEVPKTFGREVYTGAKSALGVINPMTYVHAFTDPANAQELKAVGNHDPNSFVNKAGLGFLRLGPEALGQIVADVVNPKTSVEEKLNSAPEQIGGLAGAVVAGKGLEEIAPKVVKSAGPRLKEIALGDESSVGRGPQKIKPARGVVGNEYIPPRIKNAPVPEATAPQSPLGRVAYPDATISPAVPKAYGLVGNNYVPETSEPVPAAKESSPLGRVAYPEAEPAPKPARGKAQIPVAAEHTPSNLGTIEPTGFKSAAETGEALAMRPPKSPALGEINYGGERPASETGEALGTIKTNRPITPEVVEESKAAKAAEKPTEPRYVYRVRDVGEKGVPSQSHAQATSSLEEAKKYVESRGEMTGKPQEIVRIDLNKVGADKYQALKGPNGADWTKFKEDLPEEHVSPAEEKSEKAAEASAKEPAKTGTIPYDQIADNHNKNRGFTFNPKEGFVRDQKVYSVGGEHPDLVKVIKGRKLTPEDIREFAERPEVKKVLDADPRNSIGGWNYKGNAHLEVSKLFHDKDYAIQAAKDLNQTSIYDHGTRSEIPTGGTAADEEAAKAGVKPSKVGLDARRAEIADEYEKMQHNPNDPKVKASYEALKKETAEQLEQMKKDGVKVEFTDEDPYKSYEEMKDDIQNNKRLKVWRGGNPLKEGHPLADVDPKTGENYNSIFRAVHDYFGHYVPDHDFSEVGEENAHNVHSQQFSDEARPAMTTETKGQTSWFFNNKGVRGGEPLGKFAEQKAGLLPEEFQTNKSEVAAEEKPAAKAEAKPEEKQEGLTDAMKRQMEHRLGKSIAEKLSGTPDGIEKAMRLLKGTNQQFADVANEHGPFKPGDVNAFWEASDFSRKGSKDLSPMKAKVIEHLVNQVPTKEFMDATKDWGQAQRLEEKMEGKGPAPEATAATAKMSDEELLKHGFTQEDIAAGKHLPSVKGGGAAAPAPAKEGPQIPEKVAEKMTARELEGVSKSPKKMQNFLDTMEKIPEVQEYIDIALQGEGARRWYQRSGQAFDALKEHAPQYFDEPGDKEKFLGMLAGSSPRQSVAMNLRETLRTWSAWVDAGRPEVTPESWKEYLSKAKENYEKAGSPKDQKYWDFRPKGSKWKGETLLADNLAPATSKVPNVALALTDTDMWPDLSKNMNFKVPSFADNLRKWLSDAKEEVKNSKSVTNDGWMALFGGLDPGEISHADKYHPMSVATRAAADYLGWEPEEAQAAIWSFTQALTEKGESSPEMIRQYSEDFADLLANDKQVRGYLQDMGVDLGRFDERLRKVEAKPPVTGRTTATTSRSVEKLKGRIEEARGKGAIPASKSDQGLFDSFREGPAHEGRVRDSDTEFNPEELEDEQDRKRKK